MAARATFVADTGTRQVRGEWGTGLRHALARIAVVGLSCGASAVACAGDGAAGPGEGAQSSFLFVPYPITEPTIGNGLVAGPVWMRAGPASATGPAKPQAFGAGVLWTGGGSRGVAAFDRRAWAGGRWWTTAVAGDVDLVLDFHGLAPGGEAGSDVGLHLRGGSVTLERTLAGGRDSLRLRLFAVSARTGLSDDPPEDLAGLGPQARSNGLTLGWSRDTRDDLYAPARGVLLSASLTHYAPLLGASFDGQGLALKWTGYRRLGPRGALGLRVVGEASRGDLPFYLRPYLGIRGLPALRYAGEQVASLEGEYRWSVGPRWDLLGFAGTGIARADTRGVHAIARVAAGGVGVRFKAHKYFGLTFGLDLAQGPDGQVAYVQIGNAWSR